MSRFTNSLNDIDVAAPCSADWNKMKGDGRVRFCDQCAMNVYNLSGMTRYEAETFVANAEGRVCIRFYRRRDGTILTDNCPVGLRALRRKAQRLKATASAIISVVLSFCAGIYSTSVFNSAHNWLNPSISTTQGEMVLPPIPQEKAMQGTMVVRPNENWTMGDVATPKMGKVAIKDKTPKR